MRNLWTAYIQYTQLETETENWGEKGKTFKATVVYDI